MMLCWSLEPAHRPTFKTIGQLINRLFPSTNDMSPHHSHQVRGSYRAEGNVPSALTDRLVSPQVTAYRNVDEFKEEEEQEEEEVNGEMVKRGEEEESGQRGNEHTTTSAVDKTQLLCEPDITSCPYPQSAVTMERRRRQR